MTKPSVPKLIIEQESFAIGQLQDPYTIRCIPQVHGISLDTINFVRSILEVELKTPKLYGCLGHDYMGGGTPQTPLSVFDVGFAYVRGIPPKTTQIGWLFGARLYGGETPQTPLSVL